MQTALEQVTLGYWQVMRSLRAPNTDLAWNAARLSIMYGCGSPTIRKLAAAELDRLARDFSQQIEEGSAA